LDYVSPSLKIKTQSANTAGLFLFNNNKKNKLKEEVRKVNSIFGALGLTYFGLCIAIIENKNSISQADLPVPDGDKGIDQERDLLGELLIIAQLMITGGEVKESEKLFLCKIKTLEHVPFTVIL
jgi:hypothetical protein